MLLRCVQTMRAKSSAESHAYSGARAVSGLVLGSWPGRESDHNRFLPILLDALAAEGIAVASFPDSRDIDVRGLDALVVTPICPHTLGMRSLVLPPHLDVRVKVTGRDATDALVSLDGLEAIPVGPRDAVRVRLVPDAVRFLRRPGVTLPVTVPQKLGWVGSKLRRS